MPDNVNNRPGGLFSGITRLFGGGGDEAPTTERPEGRTGGSRTDGPRTDGPRPDGPRTDGPRGGGPARGPSGPDGSDRMERRAERPSPPPAPPPPPRVPGGLRADTPIASVTKAMGQGVAPPSNPRIFPGAKVLVDGDERTLVGYTTSGRFLVKDAAGKESSVNDVTPKAGQDFTSIVQTLPASHVHKVSGAQKAALDALLSRTVGYGKKGTVGGAIDAIRSAGFEAMIAGGAVRDVVAGKEPRDVDIATTMWVSEVERALSRADLPSGSSRTQFGTLLIGSGESGLDITSLKRDKGEFGLDLKEDIRFRDFSINTLYYEPASGVILDPTGKGVEDAKNKFIRPSCPPGQEAQWLKDNPSVVLRFLKFTMKGYSYDPALLKLVKDNFARCVRDMDGFRRSRQVDSVYQGPGQKEKITEEMKRLGFPQSDIEALFPAPRFFSRSRDDDDDEGFSFGGPRSWSSGPSPGRSSGPSGGPSGGPSSDAPGPGRGGPGPRGGPSSPAPSSSTSGRYLGPSAGAVQAFAQATNRKVVELNPDHPALRAEAVQVGWLPPNPSEAFGPLFSRGFARRDTRDGALYVHRDGSFVHFVAGNVFRGVGDAVFTGGPRLGGSPGGGGPSSGPPQAPAPSGPSTSSRGGPPSGSPGPGGGIGPTGGGRDVDSGPVRIPVTSGPSSLDRFAEASGLKLARPNVSEHGKLAVASGNLSRISLFEDSAASDLSKAGFVQLEKGHWEHDDGSWVRFHQSNVYRGFRDTVFTGMVNGPGPDRS